MKRAVFAISLLFLSVSLSAQTFTADKQRSNIGFKVLNLGLNNIEGTFTDFNAKWAVKNKSLSKVSISAKTSSLDSGSSKRDSYVRSKLLRSSSIKFISSSASANKVRGKLSINGVSKVVSFSVKNFKTIRDPLSRSNKKRSGLVMEAVINRADFKITDKYTRKTLSSKLKIQINLQGTP